MTESFPVSRPTGCPFDPAQEYAGFRRTPGLNGHPLFLRALAGMLAARGEFFR